MASKRLARYAGFLMGVTEVLNPEQAKECYDAITARGGEVPDWVDAAMAVLAPGQQVVDHGQLSLYRNAEKAWGWPDVLSFPSGAHMHLDPEDAELTQKVLEDGKAAEHTIPALIDELRRAKAELRAFQVELVGRLYDHADGNTGEGCWELHQHYVDLLGEPTAAEIEAAEGPEIAESIGWPFAGDNPDAPVPDLDGVVTERPTVDLDELRSMGAIVAVNVVVLHPVGLALGIISRRVHVEFERELLMCPFCEGTRADDLFVHAEACPIAKLLAIVERQLVVFDGRDDPGGVVYGEWPPERVAKAEAYNALFEERSRVRKELIGFVHEHPRCRDCGAALVPTMNGELKCAQPACLVGRTDG